MIEDQLLNYLKKKFSAKMKKMRMETYNPEKFGVSVCGDQKLEQKIP
jgi:hypothetical protein